MIDDIPDSLLERAAMLEGLLIAHATGGASSQPVYDFLRRDFMAKAELQSLLPTFVRSHRTLDAFWPYIKKQAGTYADRREIIGAAFTPAH